jgi:hypothetical protein
MSYSLTLKITKFDLTNYFLIATIMIAGETGESQESERTDEFTGTVFRASKIMSLKHKK